MSAQSVTRALRDSKTPVIERSRIANELLVDCRFNNQDVYLPKREMVVLQWLFDLLAQDANARKEPEIWKSFVRSWEQCDDSTKRQLYQKSKFSQILVSSIEQGPIDAIDLGVQAISKTLLIHFLNDQQACAFISEFFKRQLKADSIEKLISNTVLSRPKLLKGQVNMLPLLVDTPHLDALVRNPGVDILTFVEESHVPVVFSSVISTGVDVPFRFLWLAKKFPGQISNMLEMLNTKLDKDVVVNLVDEQLKNETPDWKVVASLCNMHYEPVFDRIDDILNKLKVRWSEQVIITLITKYSQARRLPDFLVLLSKNFAVEGLRQDERTVETLRISVLSLSAHQVVQLIKILKGEWLTFVVENLSFVNTSQEAGEVLAAVSETDDRFSYAANILYPSIKKKASSSKNRDWARIAYLLRLKELDPGFEVRDKDVLRWQGSHRQAYDLTVRFFKVLDMLEENQVRHIVSFLTSVNDLFAQPEIFETKIVFQTLLDRAMKCSNKNSLLLVPIDLVSKKERAAIFDLAWTEANFALLEHCLNSQSRVTIDHEPGEYLKLLRKLDANQFQTAMDITKLLVVNDSFIQKLKGTKWSFKNWQDLVVAAASGYENKTELAEVAKANLKSGKFIEQSVAVLNMIRDVSTDLGLDISALAISNPSPSIFSLLCHQNYDWELIFAYFVYTGCKYNQAFDAFLSELDSESFSALVSVASTGYYAVFKQACARLQKSPEHVAVYTRLLISLQARFDSLTENQIRDFLSLSEYVIREQSWILDQYALEATLRVISRIASSEFQAEVSDSPGLYSAMCLVTSRILLFQRYRLNGRMALVIATLTQLLACLGKSGGKHSVTWLDANAEQAVLFVRLVGNLCNPPQQSVREAAGEHGLTSSVAKARRYVAQHVGVLIGNAVHISLQSGFKADVRAALQPGLFAMIDTVGVRDFMAVTASLDGPGRAYLKPIYDEYKASGKWSKD